MGSARLVRPGITGIVRMGDARGREEPRYLTHVG